MSLHPHELIFVAINLILGAAVLFALGTMVALGVKMIRCSWRRRSYQRQQKQQL